ncbi:MAG: S46 family peptidase, partial [Dysgonamonadaceae bacterium]|nr:S46 family peptidase [Dysgonamonadaceae bacterium]
MKKIIWSIVFLLSATTLLADEGMWMLNKLTSGNLERMKELGFTLSETELYDTINPSIKDAVVIFGGGCTGITVSGKGLIFTNHHCGFDAIQSQSSVENDYLKNGFVAQTQEDEMKIPDLEVRYLLYTENVTDRLLAAVDTIADEFERMTKIYELVQQIEDSISAGNEFIVAEIAPYYDYNEFYLNVYEVFKDIRMVFAPPSSVGKFGGETDNWMWPRHTGDFSVFRVYANAENKPATYSVDNIAYSPKYFVPVSLEGYKEHDYAMTIGFPGSTDCYLSSWGVSQRVKSSNEPRIETRGIKQDIWKDAMLKSDEIRIKYASKYAMSSNYWKNSIGMNRGIEQMNVIERKQILEKEFLDWLNENPEQKAIYGNALTLIQEGYNDTDDAKKALIYLMETLVNGAEIVRLTFAAMRYDV